MRKPRNASPRASRRTPEPAYRIVWSGIPDLERQVAALCLVLGIPVPPPVPTPSPLPPKPPAARASSRSRRSVGKEAA
jgi:hypothetical protein